MWLFSGLALRCGFQSPMGIVSSAKLRLSSKGYRRLPKFQSPMGIVSSAKVLAVSSGVLLAIVSIPDGDSFLREDFV